MRSIAARFFHKPLGYAGDFEMMNMLYRNESLGDTLFGQALSRVILDCDAARAVRHRRNTSSARSQPLPRAASRTGRRAYCRSRLVRRWNSS